MFNKKFFRFNKNKNLYGQVGGSVPVTEPYTVSYTNITELFANVNFNSILPWNTNVYYEIDVDPDTVSSTKSLIGNISVGPDGYVQLNSLQLNQFAASNTVITTSVYDNNENLFLLDSETITLAGPRYVVDLVNIPSSDLLIDVFSNFTFSANVYYQLDPPLFEEPSGNILLNFTPEYPPPTFGASGRLFTTALPSFPSNTETTFGIYAGPGGNLLYSDTVTVRGYQKDLTVDIQNGTEITWRFENDFNYGTELDWVINIDSGYFGGAPVSGSLTTVLPNTIFTVTRIVDQDYLYENLDDVLFTLTFYEAGTTNVVAVSPQVRLSSQAGLQLSVSGALSGYEPQHEISLANYNISTLGNDKVIRFDSSQAVSNQLTFYVNIDSIGPNPQYMPIDILAVGAGGAGGNSWGNVVYEDFTLLAGGGGGGGEVYYDTVTADIFNSTEQFGVKVGKGISVTGPVSDYSSGIQQINANGDVIENLIVAQAGGTHKYPGTTYSYLLDGGSGAGAGEKTGDGVNTFTADISSAGTAIGSYFGNDGGIVESYLYSPDGSYQRLVVAGAGGGGAGGAGGNSQKYPGILFPFAGNGGAGLSINISGVNETYGQGGNGGDTRFSSPDDNIDGLGQGGNGAEIYTSQDPIEYTEIGQRGGNGVVMIRYRERYRLASIE